jgi:hypothetical protein
MPVWSYVRTEEFEAVVPQANTFSENAENQLVITRTSMPVDGWYVISSAQTATCSTSINSLGWYSGSSTVTSTGSFTPVVVYNTRTNRTHSWYAQTQYVADTLRHYAPYIRPPVEKKTKSAIKRALKLIANVGFEEDAKIFLKGSTIEVSHPDSLFKFVLKKSGSIINRTEHPGNSTPYSLSLYTKSDVYVARLCVYMPETPVLDQVLAVAMFIKSGSEEMILRQANWFSLSNDEELKDIIALEYPELSRKLLR